MIDSIQQFKDVMKKVKDTDAEDEMLRNKLAAMRAGVEAGVPQQLTVGRGDQHVQKTLRDHPNALRLWQSLPIVHFLSAEYNMDMWSHPPALPDSMPRQSGWEFLCKRAMENLIWQDVIFYWVEPDTKVRLWARIRKYPSTWADYKADAITQVMTKVNPHGGLTFEQFKNVGIKYGPFEDLLSLDVCMLTVRNSPATMFQWFLNRKEPLKFVRLSMDMGNTFGGLQMCKVVSDIHCLYAYLAQSNERTVEVREAKPRASKESKTGKKKPWLRDDLPHIVMLNPTKAQSVGCTVPSAPGDEDKRRSPSPHDRRGHWRELKEVPGVREAKRIFVRPSWIGPVDWEHKGRIYKVLQDKKVDGE